ncbi:hypothetical protein BC832DRAFT_102710 [Gaertneriomyces semiglobifer]|nr:hypothetical protein BC832DRAFT_102710 [Gaertneriomyces semiglobifer]
MSRRGGNVGGNRGRGGNAQRKDFHGGNRDYADVHHGGHQYASRGGKKWSSGNGQPQRASFSNKDASLAKTSAEVQHERTRFIFDNMIGTRVRVTCTSGVAYEGIYGSNDAQTGSKEWKLVLKMASKKQDPSKDAPGTVIKMLVIPASSILSVAAVGLDFSLTKRTAVDRDSFQTDTAISGHTGAVKERTLQRWDGGASDSVLSLDDETSSGGQWDQFATNEKLFGVTTDYDEHLYTTAVDKSHPDFKRREAEAARLAREIEQGPVSNAHVAEERGLEDDSVMDEEDRYSSVIRQPGKYVPPGARRSSNAPKPELAKGKDASQGVGKDQLRDTKEAETAAKQSQQSTLSAHAPATSTKREPATATTKPTAADTVKQQPTKGTKDVTFGSIPFRKPGMQGPLAKLSSKKVASGDAAAQPEPVQTAHVAKVFKDFAVGEKEMLMHRKQTLMKQEKDQIVEEFRTFSKSFKLKTPMPEDLQEILHKSTESPKISDSKIKDDKKTVQEGQVSKASASPKPPVTAQPHAKDANVATSKNEKADQKASSTDDTPASYSASSKKDFKFNVAAAEFTPSSYTPVIPTSPPSTSPGHGDRSPYYGNRRMGKNQPYGGKQQFGKNYQKTMGSPKPGHFSPHYGEEMYPPQGPDMQFYPYAMPGPYPFRPMMARPFVPGMTMPPGPAFMMPIPQGQFPHGFVGSVPHAMYPPHMVPPPPNPNVRMYPKGQTPPGSFAEDSAGFQSQPMATSPIPAAFMRSPPPMFQPGYPPEMMGYPPMMIPGPPAGQVWGASPVPQSGAPALSPQDTGEQPETEGDGGEPAPEESEAA